MVRQIKITNQKIANYITYIRFLLGIPILIYLSNGNMIAAWGLLLIAALTDFLDGWFARRSGSYTKWGAEIDPLADKVLILAPIIWLGKSSIIPLWSIWVLIARELILTARRSKSINGLPASMSAKIKTLLQFLSILFLLFPNFLASKYLIIIIRNIGIILYWISFGMALFSAYIYFKPRSI